MPSSTLTSAGPWDSPAVVKRSIALAVPYPRDPKCASPTQGRARESMRNGEERAPLSDVARVHINHNQSFRRQAEQLHDQRRIGRLLRRRRDNGAERPVQVTADRNATAQTIAVAIHDLDRAITRRDERNARREVGRRLVLVERVECDARAAGERGE